MLLASMTWSQTFLALISLGVCGFLMLVILLQRGRGGGLTGAFGGAGGSSAFGAKTGDVFTWITVVVATIFVLLNIVGNFVFDESRLVQANPATVTAPEPLPAPPVTIPTPSGDVPVDVKPVEVVPIPAPTDAGTEVAPNEDQPAAAGATGDAPVDADEPPVEEAPDAADGDAAEGTPEPNAPAP